jgi:nucleolin
MSAEDDRKLFVAGLPESITETVLRQIFEAAGATVVDVSLPKDRATGRPRGFGFVTLGAADQAAAVRSALDGSIQSGRSISVRPFNSEPPKRGEGRPEGGGPSGPGGGGGEDRTLYVGNLPYETTPQEVEAFFKEHNVEGVARVHLPSGPDGRLRGFGFVTMANGEAANQAITGLRDADFRGRRLTVNIAHPKGSGPARPARPDGGGGGGYESIPSPPGFGGGGDARPFSARPRPAAERADSKKRKKGQRRWEHIDGKKGRQGGAAKGWDDED